MASIPIGTLGEQKVLVTHEFAIDFLGREDARVLATPWMIGLMEYTCRNSVKPILGDGWDTVGTHVDVKHLAATPMGMSVTIRTEVIACDDRRVTFRVEAFDEKEKVGEGSHVRAIIDVDKFAARLAAKR
jgi:fluoroacetyl-CoA thioesterase